MTNSINVKYNFIYFIFFKVYQNNYWDEFKKKKKNLFMGKLCN